LLELLSSTFKMIHKFYPIVPDFDWLNRLVPLGVRTIQLRLKDASSTEIDDQIVNSLEVCRKFGCQLIVNDYWQQAIKLGVDFIHLGQEDLRGADLAAIKSAGIKLGVSTHSHIELDTGLKADPDYVALGPIYETKLKVMKWNPQGLETIRDWKTRIDCPLVAIGGITVERAPAVLSAGADSVAVVTDFITHPDPRSRIMEWLNFVDPI